MFINKRLLFTLYFAVLSCCTVLSQKKTENNTNKKILNPKKATIYSAVLPGAGQIYNRKIWKTAIIYAGFAGIAYGYVYNNKLTKSYQNALNARLDTLSTTIDTKYSNLSDGTVTSLRNYHRRNRDICILSFAGLYILNIIDANVDANLQEFKINKDLSLNFKPNFTHYNQHNIISTIQFTLKF
ncbi:MAG: hypothetical protein HUU47_08485 [Bacteroidetes bacterium]|nr:hypothetical protein [Bacteroidota bacterium]